jgi:teichuronic acid biosynthesis glycosyltransferase TuaC
VHPTALDAVAGTLCAPYDRDAWRAALAPHLQASEPRVEGRARAELWSARRMARRVLDAWSEVLRLPVKAPRSGALSA